MGKRRLALFLLYNVKLFKKMSNVDYINFWCDQCENDTGLVCTGKGVMQHSSA